MSLKYTFFAATTLATLTTAPLAAQTTDNPAAPGITQPVSPDGYSPDRLTIGLGGGIGPQYDGASDSKFQPGGVLQGSISGFEFTARGPNLYVDLVREKGDSRVNIIFGPVAQLRLDRTGRIKDPRVKLFGKRDVAVELGADIGIGKRGILHGYDSLSADVSYVHDVSGEHKSYVIKPSISYFTPLSRRTVALISLSADYVGKGYGRTYFDVPAIVAPVPTLNAHSIKGSGFKSAGATVLMGQSLGPDLRKGWSLFALGSYSRLLGQYARSPIVSVAGDPNQLMGIVGIAYSF